MTKLKKYNLEGKEVGEIEVSEKLANAELNTQLIKDYIVATQKNKRQWSASTKGRSEVKHTTKKPHRQKGTGRARQGSLVGPHMRGGGVAHGPKPKFDQHVRINKKERRAAIRSLIAEKIRSGKAYIIESTEMTEPKTKFIARFLDACKIQGRTLFLGESAFQDVETDGKTCRVNVKCAQHAHFNRSIRNLKKVEFGLALNVNGYEVAKAAELFLTEGALRELEAWLCA